jgi:hypothetical protein
MRRLPLILALIIMVSACSATSEQEATPSPTPAQTAEVAAVIDVPAAIRRTVEAQTAAIDILILTTLGDQEAALAGEGFVEFTTGNADVTWSDENGVVVERRTPDGLFVHIDPPDGPWYELAEDDATPTTFSLDPLADLADVQNPINEGAETLDGQATTRFVGTAPPAGCLDGAGFSDEDRARIESSTDVVCRVSVWIDERGYIIRIDRLFGADLGPDLRASSLRSTTLSDFGEPVKITTPQQVEPAPESP